MRVWVNGIEIAYEDQGEGEQPLVLVHGFTGFRHDFASQLEGLAQHGRVLAPDLRGHGESGRSDDPSSYSFEQLTGDLLGLLDALGIERCNLLGHSMGGMLALRASLRAPERIASLVLMDTAPGPLGFVDPALLALAARVGREAGMTALAQILRARAGDDPGRGAPDRRVEEEWGPERFWAWRSARVAAMDPAAYEALGRAWSNRISAVSSPRFATRPRCWWESSTTSSARPARCWRAAFRMHASRCCRKPATSRSTRRRAHGGRRWSRTWPGCVEPDLGSEPRAGSTAGLLELEAHRDADAAVERRKSAGIDRAALGGAIQQHVARTLDRRHRTREAVGADLELDARGALEAELAGPLGIDHRLLYAPPDLVEALGRARAERDRVHRALVRRRSERRGGEAERCESQREQIRGLHGWISSWTAAT
jgi:pimeloyl-ACP methyl ester carboxylesterase